MSTFSLQNAKTGGQAALFQIKMPSTSENQVFWWMFSVNRRQSRALVRIFARRAQEKKPSNRLPGQTGAWLAPKNLVEGGSGRRFENGRENHEFKEWTMKDGDTLV